jgi:hypothetical protein
MSMASPTTTTITKKNAKRKRQQQQVDIDMGGDHSSVFDMNSTITIGAAAAHRQEEPGRTTTTGGFELPVTKEERKRRLDRKVSRRSCMLFSDSTVVILRYETLALSEQKLKQTLIRCIKSGTLR